MSKEGKQKDSEKLKELVEKAFGKAASNILEIMSLYKDTLQWDVDEQTETLREELEKLRAENQKLREALEDIASDRGDYLEIAKEALKGGDHESAI